MKSLEDLLNDRADRELRDAIGKLADSVRNFGKELGLTDPHMKLSDAEGGVKPSRHDKAQNIREHFFNGYKEVFRKKFREDFVAKVEAMQAEMGHYIGELQPEQPFEA